jgi:hypothetical protein
VKHQPRNCLRCGASFTPQNSRRRYCSNNCRVCAFNQRKRDEKKREMPRVKSGSGPVRRMRSPPSVRGRRGESDLSKTQPYLWKLLAEKTRNVRVAVPEQLILRLNQAARRFQRTRQEIIRISCEDWLDGSKRQQFRQAIEASVSEDEVSGDS